jgi:predicted lipoprotein with Yx(FWY)xxD motif
MPRHRLLPLAAIAAATLALSACGSSGSSTDPYGSVSAPAVGAPASAEPTAAPSDGPLLAAKDAPNLGKIVTDAEGYTLYRFDKDSAKPKPTTTCVDACATKWPPVTVDPKGKLGLEGVAKEAVGMVQRPDGTSQLTLGGWPVYRFAGDAEPGATGGQGSGGTWFAVTPEGKKAAGTGSGASGSGASGSAGGAGASGSAGGAASGSAGSGASGSAGSSSGGSGAGSGAAADSGY